MKKEMVTITKQEYEGLKYDSEFLNCLEACGVDNWQGYYDAKEMLEEE
ncbi:MAG: hypothetical protein ACRDDY_19460 [Clostridium sp.]